jgi:hypothetical protein
MAESPFLVFYVAPAPAGSDSNNGETPETPFEHISKALLISAATYYETLTINLAGTLASPNAYAEPIGATLRLAQSILKGRRVVIQPTYWDEAKYARGDDPFGASGGWNPAGSKPCSVWNLSINNANGLCLRGLAIQTTALPENAYIPEEIGTLLELFGGMIPGVGVGLSDGSGFRAEYCSITGGNYGITADGGSRADLVNCAILEAVEAGIVLENGSTAILTGDNRFRDCGAVGIEATRRSSVWIRGEDSFPFRNTTRIATTGLRREYAAIRLASDSVLGTRSDAAREKADTGFLRIVNERDVISPRYHGVELESRSCLLGARDVSFCDPAISDGQPTVPPGQQIVQPEGHGTLVVV